MAKNVLKFQFGRPLIAIRFWASSAFLILLIGFFALSEARAQSTNDWVGNRQLVNGIDAIGRLKQAARQIIQQPNQQTPTSTAVAQGQGTEFNFINRVIEEIAINGRSSKDAVNIVAVSTASTGVPISEVTRVTQIVIALLS